MKYASPKDTIAALSTAPGASLRAVVRVSGPAALRMLARLCASPRSRTAARSKSRRFAFDTRLQIGIATPLPAVVYVMKSPHSYTREDVVEFHVPGSPPLIEALIAKCVSSGARHALPGEFTMRAFLNGRIDLAQAEAIQSLISSRDSNELRLSVANASGHLSGRIRSAAERIAVICAEIEASLDFSDQDVGPTNLHQAQERLEESARELDGLLSASARSGVFRENAEVVLCGRTNVGKSTLFNRLSKGGKAIVSPLPGTTRDVIRGELSFRGMRFSVSDTAGMRNVRTPIETAARRHAQGAAGMGHVRVLVLDASAPLTPADVRIFRKLAEGNIVIAANKSDLRRRLDAEVLSRRFSGIPAVFVSARDGTGIAALKGALLRSVMADPAGRSSAAKFLVNSRQESALRNAAASMRYAAAALRENGPLELAALDVRRALDELGAITGEVTNEDILGMIFSKFCIGK
jgi:tRNA modification GTPase